jgi:hypothetical protein
MRLTCRLLLPCLAALAWLAPAPARACGGFFCDVVNGVPLPVDQTGENILFAIDRDAGTVEAHIQIQYTGDPQKFAWIIPVTAEPSFAIGSELLFTALLNATAPTYSFTPAQDCEERDRPNYAGCGSLSVSAEDGAGTNPSGGGDESGGPDEFEVVKREVVGAYEIVVLKGGTADELWEFLDTAGYYQDPDAAPIVDEYLKDGFYFAAAKLRHGAGVDQIQPIVMTYAGAEPCVPLKLTAIAAQDDMGVRVFALGDVRAAPSTYKHVELNEVRLDWTNGAMNYTEVVAGAIDAPGADGRGFITEYAGASDVVDESTFFSASWDSTPFAGRAPIDENGFTVIDILTQQGLIDCESPLDGTCSYPHPQVLPLLRTHLPAPDGMDEDEFYRHLADYPELIDLERWNGDKFADDLQARVVSPALRGVGLLNKWGYLTRMLTIISPHEMTRDPEFILNKDLPDVPAGHSVTMNVPCDGANKMLIGDDQRFPVLHDPFTWPQFPDAMPYALRVEQIAPKGAPQVIQDFTKEIDAALDASNENFSYDDGRRFQCAVRRGSLTGALTLGFVFAFGWIRRRR